MSIPSPMLQTSAGLLIKVIILYAPPSLLRATRKADLTTKKCNKMLSAQSTVKFHWVTEEMSELW